METLLFMALSQTFTFSFLMLILGTNPSVITSWWTLFLFWNCIDCIFFFIQWHYVSCFVWFYSRGPYCELLCYETMWTMLEAMILVSHIFFLIGLILLTLSKSALTSSQVVWTQILDIYSVPISDCAESCVMSHSTASSFCFFLLYQLLYS